MARSYKRDANGRFAGGGGSGGGGKRPAAKPVSRGANRLTRDNAGKITSVGGNGATARGGRLKTASGNQRATQTAKATGGSRAGTIKGKVTRNPQSGAKLAAAGKPKVSREPKTKAQILSQTRRIIEKASARKGKSPYSYDMVKNDRRISKATAVRQSILNPPKPKPKKRDPNRLTPTQIANRRAAASQDAWNRATRGY